MPTGRSGRRGVGGGRRWVHPGASGRMQNRATLGDLRKVSPGARHLRAPTVLTRVYGAPVRSRASWRATRSATCSSPRSRSPRATSSRRTGSRVGVARDQRDECFRPPPSSSSWLSPTGQWPGGGWDRAGDRTGAARLEFASARPCAPRAVGPPGGDRGRADSRPSCCSDRARCTRSGPRRRRWFQGLPEVLIRESAAPMLVRLQPAAAGP